MTTISKNKPWQWALLQVFKGVENCDHYILVNPASQSPFPVPQNLYGKVLYNVFSNCTTHLE